MKNIKLLNAISLLAVFVSQLAFSDPISFKPESILMKPESTFIPSGFDDNDNVQLVVYGNLPNTCYKTGPVVAQVDQKEKKIYIENRVYIYSGCWCAQVVVPYTQTINLGIMQTGRYEVFVKDQQEKPHSQGMLNVAVSKSASPDDFLYAPVQDSYIDSSDSSLVLRGQFSSDCMHLQEVKVNYPAPNLIEVLPIAAMNDNRICHSVSVPFETRVKIKGPLSGSTLIYVRSLNGQAISRVVEF